LIIALTVQDEGATAAAKGRSTTSCPYIEGDPRRDQWIRGWQAVMEKCQLFGSDRPNTKTQ
jgi:ribosome modulation factor